MSNSSEIGDKVSEGPRKVDVRLPGKGNSNSHGARPVHLIITMMKWIRTSRLSIKNFLCAPLRGVFQARMAWSPGFTSQASIAKKDAPRPSVLREGQSYRGTSLIRNRPPPRTTLGP